jgi:hypothetical protein
MDDDLPVVQVWADIVTLSGIEAADALMGMGPGEREVGRVLEALVKSYGERDAATGVAIRCLEERIAALEAAAGLDGNP